MANAPSILVLLEHERDALDALIADVSVGPRDQRHYDALEERAQGIAVQLRAAFRRGTR